MLPILKQLNYLVLMLAAGCQLDHSVQSKIAGSTIGIIAQDEAEKIALSYSLKFLDSLKAPQSDLTFKSGLRLGLPKTYGINVGNAPSNNDYWCNFNVIIDAETGKVLADDPSTSRSWVCTFLDDYG